MPKQRDRRSIPLPLQRLCATSGGGGSNGAGRSLTLPPPELWAAGLLGSRPALRCAANAVTEARALLFLVCEAAGGGSGPPLLLLEGPSAPLRRCVAAWVTECVLADADAAATDPSLRPGVTAWVDLAVLPAPLAVSESIASAAAERRPWLLVAAGGLATGAPAALAALLPPASRSGGGGGLIVLLCEPSDACSLDPDVVLREAAEALSGGGAPVPGVAVSPMSARDRRSTSADALAASSEDAGSIPGSSEEAEERAAAAIAAALAAARSAGAALDALPEGGGTRERLEDVAALVDAADALLAEAVVPSAAAFTGGEPSATATRAAAAALGALESWCAGAQTALTALCAALGPPPKARSGPAAAAAATDRFAAVGSAATSLRTALLRSPLHPSLGPWRAALLPQLDATLRIQRDVADVRAAQRAEAAQVREEGRGNGGPSLEAESPDRGLLAPPSRPAARGAL